MQIRPFADVRTSRRTVRRWRGTDDDPVTPVRHLAQAVDRPDADAVVLSCTDLPTLPLIAALEADLGKPVVTSCQATVWQVLRAAGVADRLAGAGRLFALG